MFTHPGLTAHALSISGVHVSHLNDSLKEVKKIDTESRQARGEDQTTPSAERPTYLTAVPR